MEKRYRQSCPAARTLEIVGERWTLLIVRDLMAGPLRFQQLRQSLAGISPNLLSERLKRLENHGILQRQVGEDHPPQSSYSLTAKGRELSTAVGALFTWGVRHLDTEIRLVHEACSGEVDVVFFCETCRTPVARSECRRTITK